MIVLCEIKSCAFCGDGYCQKDIISHTRQTFSGFQNGEREWSPACEDYEEVDDD